MEIEIWSDVVCPWCYLGKRRLEHALEAFPQRDQVRLTWRSYELDPRAPRAPEPGDPIEHLVHKYGMSREQAADGQERLTRLAADEGLEYHLDRARPTNTFDAHRLVLLAERQGLGGQAVERLFKAHFTEGLPIGDHEVLADLLAEVGVPREEAVAVLRGDQFDHEVHEEEALGRRFGVEGVPFFVFDRHFAFSGAQSPDVFAATLQEAWEHAEADPEGQPR